MNKKKMTRKEGVLKIFAPIFAIAIAFLASYLVTIKPDSFWLAGCICAVLYVGVLMLALSIADSIDEKKAKRASKSPLLTSVMYEKMNAMTEPVILCDANQKIIWANKMVQQGNQPNAVIGSSLGTALFEYSYKSDKVGLRAVDTIVSYKGRNYIVEEEAIESVKREPNKNNGGENKVKYYLLTLRDTTELLALKQQMADEDKIVGYIIVDNLEELLQFEQESYRSAANQAEKYIRDFGESLGGFVKEYERDKYLLIFDAIHSEQFKNENDDPHKDHVLLEQVRENLKVGRGHISVTLSGGFALVKGNMKDRENAAHVALDIALQRGGDQFVFKTDTKNHFVGAKASATQKRDKVRARVVGNELAHLMSKASNVIIMAHKYPDYDAIGSSVGLARLAMHCGVKVNIVTDFNDANIKRCLKRFKENPTYKSIFVNESKGLDLVRSDTLLVLTDVNNPKIYQSDHIAKSVSDIVVIDHHRKTAEFETEPLITYIETSASSASELVSEILEQVLPVNTLTTIEASMLYAGIVLDTNHFSKCTGTKTYSAAMYLRDNNASYEGVQDLFKTSLKEYKQESLFCEKIEIYRNCIAIATNENGVDTSDKIMASKVADNMLGIENVAASFVLVVIDNVVHISARSAGSINVQSIAEALGGGGRYDAAGAQVKDTIGTTLLRLKAAIDARISSEE